MRIAVVNKMPGKIYPYNLQRVNAGLGLGVKIGALPGASRALPCRRAQSLTGRSAGLPLRRDRRQHR